MPSMEMIAAVAVAGLLLSASPGPSMLYVLSRSVGQSRGAGFASTFGLAIGGVILALATALGLAALFQLSPTAFTLLQVAGGIYLCYLGYDMISGIGRDDMSVDRVRNQPFSSILYQGIVVELLNPKTAIFLIAFLPQFVDYSRTDVTSQMLFLGMLVPLTAIPSDIVVSVAGGSLASRLAGNPVAGRALAWAAGLILIGLGLRILIAPFWQ